MKPLRYLSFLLLVLCLNSCASKYAERSWGPFSGTTGYYEVPVDENTYRIMFDGNAWTSAELVDRYALYRAAEITQQRGYDYFVVVDGQNTSNLTIQSGPPVTNTSTATGVDATSGQPVAIGVATTTQSVSSYTTHSTVKMVKLYKGTKPENLASAYNAQAMISVMGPYIKR